MYTFFSCNLNEDFISCVDRPCEQIAFREQCIKRSDCFYNPIRYSCRSKGIVIFLWGNFVLPHENHGKCINYLFIYLVRFFICRSTYHLSIIYRSRLTIYLSNHPSMSKTSNNGISSSLVFESK
jgi:hypothetical protein